MSALDDIIARDAGTPKQSSLDAIIARDSTQQPSAQSSSQNGEEKGWGRINSDRNALGNFIYGGVKGAADIVQAPIQLVMNGSSKLLQSGILGEPGPASQALIRKTNEYDDYLKQQEDIYQNDTQGESAGAAGAGRILSGALPFIASAGTDAAPAVPGIINMLKTFGANAAKGATYGSLTSPVTNVTTSQDGGNDYLGEKGKQALISGLLSGGVPLFYDIAKTNGMGAYNAVKPIINPKGYVGQQFAKSLGSDAGSVAQNIKNSSSYVPGSMPTTAQAGQVPTLVATEKALANSDPNFKISLAQRESENNAARWQAIQSVAKTPEELTQAQTARSTAAGPLYDAAHGNTAPVDDTFVSFARRPAVQQAIQQADILAKNEGVDLKWPSQNDPAISGKALDYTSRALRDMTDAAKRAGNDQQARALSQSQDYLQKWTEDNVPGVRDAARVYAEHSVPVNTMEAGQQISGSLGTRALDANGLPQLQLSPYRTALVQALKSQKYGIAPDALTSLQGVGQDLQRSTVSNSLRTPGSDTAYNISANGWLGKQLYGQNYEGAGNAAKLTGAAAAAVTGHPMVAGGILAGGNKAGQFVGGRLNKELGNFLLNPSEFLPYLEGVNATPRNKALSDAIQRYLVPFTGATASRVGLVNSNN